jgi:hypothetical protein
MKRLAVVLANEELVGVVSEDFCLDMLDQMAIGLRYQLTTWKGGEEGGVVICELGGKERWLPSGWTRTLFRVDAVCK